MGPTPAEGLLGELGISKPLLVTTPRWTDLGLRAEAVFDGVLAHVPSETVEWVCRSIRMPQTYHAGGNPSWITDVSLFLSPRVGSEILKSGKQTTHHPETYRCPREVGATACDGANCPHRLGNGMV